MKCKFRNCGGDGKVVETTVAGYVEHRLEVFEDGAVEVADARANNAVKAVARLVEELADIGMLVPDQIMRIVGRDSDRLAIEDAKITLEDVKNGLSEKS